MSLTPTYMFELLLTVLVLTTAFYNIFTCLLYIYGVNLNPTLIKYGEDFINFISKQSLLAILINIFAISSIVIYFKAYTLLGATTFHYLSVLWVKVNSK